MNGVKDSNAKANRAVPELRMWLLIRKDLPMPPGKLAAQAGHGYGTCLWLSNGRDPDLVALYMSRAQVKIAVAVKNEEELLKCVETCKEAGLVAVSVKDAAHTVFNEPTYTVGAVGPCYRKDLPARVARLRLFQDWQLPSGE
jgi:peptidyl-tRNA hydrolase